MLKVKTFGTPCSLGMSSLSIIDPGIVMRGHEYEVS
jgi:hypothetical protein